MASFILVPGLLHTAAHFSELVRLLSGDGQHEAVAVDLPPFAEEQPDPLGATLRAQVAAIIAAVDAASKPVVLVGHSTAGCLISAVAEERSSAIQKLVFLAAETLPGPPSFTLSPAASWAGEGLFEFRSGGNVMAVAQGKVERVAEILFSGAAEDARQAAAKLLTPSLMINGEMFADLRLDRYWNVPKAYIKCLQDKAMALEHQEIMFSRLQERALDFALDAGHGPFVSCPQALAALLLDIAARPEVQFAPLRQLCEAAWAPSKETAIEIEVLVQPQAPAVAPEPSATTQGLPPPSRQQVPQVGGSSGSSVAYRISKSRRDSSLAKVLKFPSGVAVGAPVFYWYESFVDDPSQYTNSRLNVPERGHEAPLDVEGSSRSLCARGSVSWAQGSRVACSWQSIATKRPGETWAQASDKSQVWGIDGREWNGSHMSTETGSFIENLAQYTRGSADAFWEDVPRKAMALVSDEGL